MKEENLKKVLEMGKHIQTLESKSYGFYVYVRSWDLLGQVENSFSATFVSTWLCLRLDQ